MPDYPAQVEAEIEAAKPYDANDPKQVNEQRSAAGRKERRLLSVVAGLMDLKDGREWLYSVLEECHIWQTSFDDNSKRMAFKEGQRNVGLRLLGNIMAAAPERYVAMVTENKSKR